MEISLIWHKAKQKDIFQVIMFMPVLKKQYLNSLFFFVFFIWAQTLTSDAWGGVNIQLDQY